MVVVDDTRQVHRWKQRLQVPLFILLAPVVLPLSVAVLVPYLTIGYIWSECTRRWRAQRLKHAMRSASIPNDHTMKRFIEWDAIRQLMRESAVSSGTLIIDHASLGWSDLDVWWTQDSLIDRAQRDGIEIPRPPHEQTSAEVEARLANPIFDRWCNAKYLNAPGGIAQLVQCTHWARSRKEIDARINEIKRLRPQLEIVESCSCFLSPWLQSRLAVDG